jgi:hypothetical protein
MAGEVVGGATNDVPSAGIVAATLGDLLVAALIAPLPSLLGFTLIAFSPISSRAGPFAEASSAWLFAAEAGVDRDKEGGEEEEEEDNASLAPKLDFPVAERPAATDIADVALAIGSALICITPTCITPICITVTCTTLTYVTLTSME